MNRRYAAPVTALLVTLLALAGLLRGQVAAPETTKRLFWKITSPTTEVYFLGSVHVATPDMYPLPAEVEAAFERCKALVVEADITKVNQLTLALEVMQKGMYAEGDALEKHLTPDTLAKLQAYCRKENLPVATFSTMKPVMAAMTIQALFMQKQGLVAENGIDMHFLNKANADKEKIVELESADAQIKLMFSIDEKQAEKWLAETLKESSKDELDRVINAWKQGDDKALAGQLAEEEKADPDAAKLSDLLIYQRNNEMVKKIDALLKEKETSFVVVGAAHLVGDKGIIKQLEAKGYKVERPTLTAPPRATTRP